MMKRILLALSVVCFLSTTAHAKIIQPKGHTFGEKVRIIGVEYRGWSLKVTSERQISATCVERTTVYYAFFKETGRTVETVCQP